jgi:AcrR family transcriptional regulator
VSISYSKLIWDLFAIAPSPRHRKMILIIESSIKVFASKGLSHGNFQNIAERCKISRPLIKYYFKSKEDLFEKTIHYIRFHWQQFVIEEIKKAKNSSKEQLKRYIYATLEWSHKYPTYYRVQVLFYFHSSKNSIFREANTKLVQTGVARVKSILELGNIKKEWSIVNTDQAALRIHILLTGAALSLNTENKKESFKEISKLVFDQIELESASFC